MVGLMVMVIAGVVMVVLVTDFVQVAVVSRI